MKKRILSILLAMCMLMSLLPVAAFATGGEGEAASGDGIYPAILHDTRTEGAIDDADLIGDDYDVTSSTGEDGANILTISGSNLKRHKNAQDKMGYWVGVAFVAPANATGFKYSMGNDAVGSENTLEENVTADGDRGVAFYFDAGAADKEKTIKLQWIGTATTDGEDDAETSFQVQTYTVKLNVQLADPTTKEIGFFADGTKANTAINTVKTSIGLSGTTSDSDKDTMYFAVDNLDPNKYYTAKVKAPGEDGYLTCRDQETANGAIDVRQGTNGAYVLYITLNPTDANMQTGSWVYTGNTKPSDADNPYKTKAGTYTFELYEADSASGTPTKVDSATATITLGSVTVKSSADDASPEVAFFNTEDNALKVSDLIDGIVDLSNTATTFFVGWKADGSETTLKAADLNNVVPTASVVYTPVFDTLKIDTSKDVTLQKSAANVNGVNVKVVNGEDNKGTITISGGISGLTGTAADYTLAFVKNNGEDGTATINLKLDGTTVVTEPATATITVGAYTYTVIVTGLELLPTDVEIGDSGASEVAISAPADSIVLGTGEGGYADNDALKAAVKEATASFDTNNETLVGELKAKAMTADAETLLGTISGEAEGTYTKIEVVPYLNIDIAGYNHTEKTLTLNIEAYVGYQAVSDNPGKDPIPVGEPTKVTNQKNVGSVDVSFKAPAFATGGTTTLYVRHDDTYEYDTTWNASVYTFTNPHGFSQFVVTDASVSEASITSNGTTTKYLTLQAAVDKVEDGQTITLLGNCAEAATVGRVVSFIVDPTGSSFTYTINPGDGYKNDAETANEFNIVKDGSGSSSTPGSSGGGGSSATVSVSSTSNGKVTVSNSNAKKGDTVTITLTPNDGYVVDTVTVTDSKGNTVEVSKTDDTHYTFVMPDGRVTVKATFKQADVTPPPATGFTDVAADAYYADAVKWAVENNITNGLTATTFGPNNSCTRGQMVTFLWRAAGSPAATSTNSFSDVASGEYYYDAVLWAVEEGITNGTSATTFSPNATVTRGQTVTFLYRYAGSPAVSGDNSFSDVASGEFYADAVTWAVAEGITNGTSATTFAPASNCTRGQIVTFLYRQIAE